MGTELAKGYDTSLPRIGERPTSLLAGGLLGGFNGESGSSTWLDGGPVRSTTAPSDTSGTVSVPFTPLPSSRTDSGSPLPLGSSSFWTALFLDPRAFAIKSLKEVSCFVAHAAPSKSLSLICAPMLAALDMVGARLPIVLSHTSKSCMSSDRLLGFAESQLAFHNVIHSWCLFSSICREPAVDSPSSPIFLRSAVSLSMEYASAGSRSGAFVGVGGFWKRLRAEPNPLPPRLFAADDVAFCG